MEKLIRAIVTEIKFLYPCITYSINIKDDQFTVVSETKVSRLYPIKRSVPGMESMGEDYWGRFTFKDENCQYYCEMDGELYFKGNDIEGEPHYTVKNKINFEIPELDEDLVKFDSCIDKVKNYINKNTDLKLVQSESSLEEGDSVRESKIICHYTIKV